MTMEEKRSQKQENAQLSLLPGALPDGVGARQTPQAKPPRGGGYQDVCTVLDFQNPPSGAKKNAPPDDPRLEELRRMGLSRVWLRVAESIGIDAFLATWRILDADPSTWHNESILRVRLRPYRSYLRYQRNRYIEALTAQGLKPPEIKRRLQRQLGETVSHRHITRLGKGDRLIQA
ncbi:MAG: hypothetical protein A2040_10725 [Rhodocyclales bacterium GWA2_65_19]|nr:MAG: hypothetical protein A2040_10725 [Rhodocyclales bacterium GWA2_65_19]